MRNHSENMQNLRQNGQPKPLRLAIGAALAMSFAAQSSAALAKGKADKLTIDHLMQMQSPSDLQISPDGKWTAYVVDRYDMEKDEGFSQIHMTSIDGKTTLPMTARYANASDPRWNTDGSKLAFLGVRGDEEEAETQVWVLDMRGGEAVQYTNVPQGVNSFEWAPSDDRLALLIKDEKPEIEGEDADAPQPWVIDRLQFKRDYVGYLDRRRTHIYVQNGPHTDGHEPLQITFGDYDDYAMAWSPDGSKIAFVSKREGDPDANNNSDIWTVPAYDKRDKYPLTQITTNKGPDSSPAWSPDGAEIAYITALEPEKLWYATDHLAVISARGGNPNVLSAKYDRFVYSPAFSADGKSVLALTDDGGDDVFVRFDAVSGTRSAISKSDISVSEFAQSPNGQIVTLQSAHHDPKNVYAYQGGKAARLTALNADVLDGVKLAKVERLSVKGWNGDMVESFVYYPPGYRKGKRYPVLFDLHGGPVSQHNSAFDDMGQLYAANGYVAVLPNPHGSTGYGHDFTYALNRQWGVPDFADVDAIADHLVDSGIADPDRMGVGGWSYGGILTNYVITKSTRFAGAVSGASEVNHRANYGHDIYQHEWEVELGLPWEDIEAWESMNPFNDLGKVTTPTLVMGGKEDWNVPIQNSEQLYQVLKRRGIETQLVVYPDESHGFSRPSFVKDVYERYLGWFDTYVKDVK